MATKVLRDDSTRIRNMLINRQTGNIDSESQALMVDRAYAVAVFSRKKPNPLTATPFQVVEEWMDSNVYERNQSSVHRRVGSWTFVYNTSIIRTRTIEDSGELSLARARNKISGAGQNLGEALVELDQTIDMLRGTLSKLDQIGEALANGRWGKLESMIKGEVPGELRRQAPTKRLANGYLAIMFGWLPLLSSAHDAVTAYGNGMLTVGSERSSRSGRKRLDIRGGPSIQAVEGSASFRGTVRSSNLATLNQYGLLNPLLMAWNRVPYSFVFDWFLPVGTVLGSITATAGLENIISTRTSVKLTEHYSLDHVFRRVITYQRIPVGSSPPFPKLWGRQAQLSIGKLISSVALLRQRYR